MHTSLLLWMQYGYILPLDASSVTINTIINHCRPYVYVYCTWYWPVHITWYISHVCQYNTIPGGHVHARVLVHSRSVLMCDTTSLTTPFTCFQVHGATGYSHPSLIQVKSDETHFCVWGWCFGLNKGVAIVYRQSYPTALLLSVIYHRY